MVGYLHKLMLEDVEMRIYGLIYNQLLNGVVNKSTVARALNMSTRTLQNSLASRGLTFRELLDRARFERAILLLEDPSRSAKETALSLGFSSASNFARAFKRWTGRSPTDFRQATTR